MSLNETPPCKFSAYATVLLTLGSDNPISKLGGLINSEITITFPDEACAVTCTWKACLLLKRLFKNKN